MVDFSDTQLPNAKNIFSADLNVQLCQAEFKIVHLLDPSMENKREVL